MRISKNISKGKASSAVLFVITCMAIRSIRKKKQLIEMNHISTTSHETDDSNGALYGWFRFSAILSMAFGLVYALVSWGRKEEVFPPENSSILGISVNKDINFYPLEFSFFAISSMCLVAMIIVSKLLISKQASNSFLSFATIGIFIGIILFSINIQDETTLGRMEKNASNDVSQKIIESTDNMKIKVFNSDYSKDQSKFYESDNTLIKSSAYILDPIYLTSDRFISTRYNSNENIIEVSRVINKKNPLNFEEQDVEYDKLDYSESKTKIIRGDEDSDFPFSRITYPDNEERILALEKIGFENYRGNDITISLVPEEYYLKDSCYFLYTEFFKDKQRIYDNKTKHCSTSTVTINKNFLKYEMPTLNMPRSDFDGYSSRVTVTKSKDSNPLDFVYVTVKDIPVIKYPTICLEGSHKGKPQKNYKRVIGGKDLVVTEGPGNGTFGSESSTKVAFQEIATLNEIEPGTCDDINLKLLKAGQDY